eukprot:Gregarina_sp_Poly_1__8575@NODE_508_length_7840_cov_67_044127_g406_i0_p1_GENE_NODE_508_length_7840_cov_67_044127_g406_i0NODE_508_length_7840_cov_67_044127_g406_i0_p1_ORF_typecomplete_len1147_score157_44_NODE_508_length_7840_cov_67_044127_g406_i040877527
MMFQFLFVCVNVGEGTYFLSDENFFSMPQKAVTIKCCSTRTKSKSQANEFLNSSVLLGCVNGIFCPAAFSSHPTAHCQQVEDTESAITAYEDLGRWLQSLEEKIPQTDDTGSTAGLFSLLHDISVPHRDTWPFIRDNLARVSGIELPAIELDTVRNDIVDLMRDIKLPLTAASYATLFDEIAKRIAKRAPDESSIPLKASTAPFIKRKLLEDGKKLVYSLNFPRMTKSRYGEIEQIREEKSVWQLSQEILKHTDWDPRSKNSTTLVQSVLRCLLLNTKCSIPETNLVHLLWNVKVPITAELQGLRIRLDPKHLKKEKQFAVYAENYSKSESSLRPNSQFKLLGKFNLQGQEISMLERTEENVHLIREVMEIFDSETSAEINDQQSNANVSTCTIFNVELERKMLGTISTMQTQELSVRNAEGNTLTLTLIDKDIPARLQAILVSSLDGKRIAAGEVTLSPGAVTIKGESSEALANGIRTAFRNWEAFRTKHALISQLPEQETAKVFPGVLSASVHRTGLVDSRETLNFDSETSKELGVFFSGSQREDATLRMAVQSMEQGLKNFSDSTQSQTWKLVLTDPDGIATRYEVTWSEGHLKVLVLTLREGQTWTVNEDLSERIEHRIASTFQTLCKQNLVRDYWKSVEDIISQREHEASHAESSPWHFGNSSIAKEAGWTINQSQPSPHECLEEISFSHLTKRLFQHAEVRPGKIVVPRSTSRLILTPMMEAANFEVANCKRVAFRFALSVDSDDENDRLGVLTVKDDGHFIFESNNSTHRAMPFVMKALEAQNNSDDQIVEIVDSEVPEILEPEYHGRLDVIKKLAEPAFPEERLLSQIRLSTVLSSLNDEFSFSKAMEYYALAALSLHQAKTMLPELTSQAQKNPGQWLFRNFYVFNGMNATVYAQSSPVGNVDAFIRVGLETSARSPGSKVYIWADKNGNLLESPNPQILKCLQYGRAIHDYIGKYGWTIARRRLLQIAPNCFDFFDSRANQTLLVRFNKKDSAAQEPNPKSTGKIFLPPGSGRRFNTHDESRQYDWHLASSLLKVYSSCLLVGDGVVVRTKHQDNRRIQVSSSSISRVVSPPNDPKNLAPTRRSPNGSKNLTSTRRDPNVRMKGSSMRASKSTMRASKSPMRASKSLSGLQAIWRP